MRLLLQDVRLTLPEFELAVDLECREQATAVMGPSGAGKTTLLEIIAGLRVPRTARIHIANTVLVDTRTSMFVPARLRRVAYVPQDLALFPQLSARGNVLYGQPDGDVPSRVTLKQIADVLEIAGLLDRSIAELSRGEQQRVALARAVMSAPRLLLLDEPLSNLDGALKRQVLPFLKRLRDEFALPMLYVTHDLAEASELCAQVVVLERGRVVRTE
jgi:molybdate transport system ATP-binding protein